MSGPRPNFLDLRSQSQASISRPLKSPRLHVAGEAPPEFSPLDAFAMQSRLLAKQLEDSAKQGRRMSRLPPLTTESPVIIQGRSEYFRSLSQDSGSEHDESPSGLPMLGLGLSPAVEEEDISHRPMSMHPRMSRIPPTPDDSIPLPNMQLSDAARGRPLHDIEEDDSYFGIGARREESPTPMESLSQVDSHTTTKSAHSDNLPVPASAPSAPWAGSPERAPIKQNSFDSASLLPPRQLFPKRSSSIMSSTQDSTGEDGVSALGSSYHSQGSIGQRKLSTSSGMISPGYGSFQRSSSISSEASGLPRPSFNFSRPMSRAGTPTLDPPARQASSDSQTSFILHDDSAHTPISMNGEGFPDMLPPEDSNGASGATPTYSKFSLPRGKALQRNSVIFDSQPSPQFPPDHLTFAPPDAHPFSMGGQAPPSPPTRPASSAGSRIFEEPIPRPSLERSKLSTEVLRPAQQPSPDPSRPSTEGSRLSEDAPRGRTMGSPAPDVARSRTAPSIATTDSASTIKASSRSQFSTTHTTSEMTAEEHVAKAIELHEKGPLNESTYHLRHAARQGHPTGMLLYALACRHGWGMRANQREGVEWLRKAVESASIEIADDEEHVKEGKSVDVTERKTRKAQLALSVYELGVSHMNGWGIVQDRALALRCFEIAGCE